ncbi:MAG: tRNA preQ1(34) S-adenosylmethionine ribosyltransferase-isomerase QueA [Clostridia bacterium]|nr:tRNA preQ1(34) S-adenosylmethionine ribosyltransferase-isomerase QueA [Clostridia bacterium]
MEEIDFTKKSTYFYNLPEELIAQTPLEKRDHSRLLCFDMDKKEIEHNHFYDIEKFLNKGDVLVLNNTRVMPCRLLGVKEETGANVEIFIIKRINLTDWECLAKPGKRLKVGTIVKFNDELSCEILGDNNFGGKNVRFIFEGTFEDVLSRVGIMPLPPYIKKRLENSERYQTVYSKTNGSTAAPTAGLHFTTELLEKLKNKGVEICYVLLHVGLGTFRPVKEESILNHDMHTEYYELTEEVADKINKAKSEGRRIVAVGTTSVRTLESAVNSEGKLVAQTNTTKLFCYPPYKFKIVDSLITNFHLPESTLIMLVSAFAGYNETMKVYNEAIKEKYRFFSFGDACFFHKKVK